MKKQESIDIIEDLGLIPTKKTYRKEATIPDIQFNAAACISKLPPLRTRELSPRIHITVKNGGNKKSSMQVGSPSVKQWEDDSPGRRHNFDNLALTVIESATYGIGGKTSPSMTNVKMAE